MYTYYTLFDLAFVMSFENHIKISYFNLLFIIIYSRTFSKH